MRYEYWVAYSHGRGFGGASWQTPEPITTVDQVTEVAREIESRNSLRAGEVVVLTWTLLQMIPVAN